MYRVKCVDKIDESGLAALGDGFRMVEGDAAADVLLVRSSKLCESKLDGVLAVARAGAGVNNIPVEWCSAHGVAVFNTPGANANAVKELTICGLLMCSRKVVEGADWVKNLANGEGDIAKEIERGKKQFAGPEISGKKLGIVGLGAIGQGVAQAALALGMRVIASDPYAENSGDIPLLGLGELFAVSDYISLHLPLNDRTKGLVNAELLSKLKHGARLLNFARGGLVDSEAILAAVKNGRLAAYVTDFPDRCMIGVQGVLALPHLGASTPESEQRCAVMAAEEVREYIENGNVRNSVNIAEMNVPRADGTGRICVIHTGGAEKIASVAGEFKIKPMNLKTEIKGEMSYTIIDCDLSVSDIERVSERLLGLNQTVRVRILA